MSQVPVEFYSALPLLLEIRSNKQVLSRATGFIADSPSGPVLVTCRHVVTGRDNNTNELISKTGAIPDELGIRHNGANAAGSIDAVVSVTEPLCDAEGAPLWREHPTLGGKVDVVALPLRWKEPIVFLKSTLGIGDPAIVCRPSEKVSVVGFPFGRSGPGQFAIWTTGFIASEIELKFDGLPCFLIDCRTREGQSGSPVVAYRVSSAITEAGDISIGTGIAQSRFLGVYSGRIRPDSDIGTVWKAEAVRSVVQNTKASST